MSDMRYSLTPKWFVNIHTAGRLRNLRERCNTVEKPSELKLIKILALKDLRINRSSILSFQIQITLLEIWCETQYSVSKKASRHLLHVTSNQATSAKELQKSLRLNITVRHVEQRLRYKKIVVMQLITDYRITTKVKMKWWMTCVVMINQNYHRKNKQIFI